MERSRPVASTTRRIACAAEAETAGALYTLIGEIEDARLQRSFTPGWPTTATEGGQTASLALDPLPTNAFGYALMAEESYDPPTAPLDAAGQGGLVKVQPVGGAAENGDVFGEAIAGFVAGEVQRAPFANARRNAANADAGSPSPQRAFRADRGRR